MHPIPTSVMAAVACSTAAGKNPWLPFALLFLLGAPLAMPSVIIDPTLHDAMHELGPAWLLWTLGGTFLALAALDSLADKLPFVERWLVPVSTAWRPFAGIAVSSLVAIAVARDAGRAAHEHAQLAWLFAPRGHVLLADTGIVWTIGGVLALSIVLGSLFAAISTVMKTGTRLVLSIVPVPGLRLLHSFLDDLFAIAAVAVGLGSGHTLMMLVAATIYLAFGLVMGPLFTRLAWIHFRVGLSLLEKTGRFVAADAPRGEPPPPRWLARLLEKRGLAEGERTLLPAYTYRAPVVGRARAGWLVFAEGHVWFATKKLFGVRVLELDDDKLARVGLGETTTERVVTLVERTPNGGLREAAFRLYPAEARDILPILAKGMGTARLVRVRATSETARAALPGYAQRGASVRYLAAEGAGNLYVQALVTIGTAVVVGVLTGGICVPIGAGYLLSPHKRRFALGLLLTAWLSACVLLSGGLGWPAAVAYAVLANLLALRDLARLAVKAKVEGFVDRRAWLPLVADHVWVPESGVLDVKDVGDGEDLAAVSAGGWRGVVAWLDQPSLPAAEPAT